VKKMPNGSKIFRDSLKQRRTRSSSRRAKGEIRTQSEECHEHSAEDPTNKELEELARMDRAKQKKDGHGMGEEELKAALKSMRELKHRRHHKAMRKAADAKSRIATVLLGQNKKQASNKPMEEVSDEERKAALRASRNERKKAARAAKMIAESLSNRKPRTNTCRRLRLKAKRKANGTLRKR